MKGKGKNWRNREEIQPKREHHVLRKKLINETPTDIAHTQRHVYIKLLNKMKLVELKEI